MDYTSTYDHEYEPDHDGPAWRTGDWRLCVRCGRGPKALVHHHEQVPDDVPVWVTL